MLKIIKVLKIYQLLLICCLILLIPSLAFAETYKEWTPKENVPIDKTWTIKFNEDINRYSINSDNTNVYIEDSESKIINIKIENVDTKTIKVIPVNNYEYEKTYYLYIINTIKTFNNDGNLKESIKMKFTTINPPVIVEEFGNIKGTITWQYNRYIGTKADTGARIALIPKNLDKNLDNSFFCSVISQIPQGKDGIYTGKADGYGYYEINDVPIGQYYLLLVSRNTFSSGNIYGWDANTLKSVFSENDYSSLELNLKIYKYKFTTIEIKKDKTITESHDFGYTYI